MKREPLIYEIDEVISISRTEGILIYTILKLFSLLNEQSDWEAEACPPKKKKMKSYLSVISCRPPPKNSAYLLDNHIRKFARLRATAIGIQIHLRRELLIYRLIIAAGEHNATVDMHDH